VALTERDIAFLQDHHAAAMITSGEDGVPKAVRVGVALVDGELWSSGTLDRARTGRLRRDPRCAVFVFDAGYAWLSLETTVTILDGSDAPALNLRLFRQMQARPSGPLSWFDAELSEEEFLQRMVEEGRLIYRFAVHRSYGMP
jgi:Pyridoxamine 5'-phosphate oxidase